MASDGGGIIPEDDGNDQRNYGFDLFIDTWCDSCSTYVSIEEFGVQDEIGWNREVCDCGDIDLNYRLAPWPREEMEFIDGWWQWPDEETMNESLTAAGALRAEVDDESIEGGESSDDSEGAD
jgi:hypothetical protein